MKCIELRVYNPTSFDKYFDISIRDGYLWLANEEGEGMGIGEDKIYKTIEQFFKENH